MISSHLTSAVRVLTPLLLTASIALSSTARADDDAASKAAKAERLAFIYLEGDEEHEVDIGKAIQLFEKAAAAGRPIAQVALADIYMTDKERKDPKRAAEWYRAAARQGVASAQSSLGWMYLAGEALPRNYEQALQWFTSAARQGDAYGLYMLATMYYRGEGVTEDDDLGYRLLQRSAELGLHSAWKDFGMVLLRGAAERRDAKLGVHYLLKAAETEDAQSQFLMGMEYALGTYVHRNLVRSAEYFKRAADRKLILASMYLSEFHAKGLGVERNPQRAKKMLSDALRTATLSDRNEFAWTLSVTSVSELRNGPLAIQVLEPALAKETKKPAAYIDTLAAAYAESGQFDRAIETQQAAIAAVPATATKMKAELTTRLELYRTHKPYREPDR